MFDTQSEKTNLFFFFFFISWVSIWMKAIEMIHQLFLDTLLVKNPVISLGNTKNEKNNFPKFEILELISGFFQYNQFNQRG